MAKFLLKKTMSLLILALMLTLTITVFFVPKANAETRITSIAPISANVGTTIELNGTISTENGTYTIKFDETVIASGGATGYTLNATFTVPSTYAGGHNVTLIDDARGENHTVIFTVLALYSLEVAAIEPPKQQRQEGDSAAITANIIGGDQSAQYVANITVQIPTNASYTKLVNIATSDKGNGTATVSFPTDFKIDNPNSNTNFTGEYKVFFNTTFATQTFLVGLTNSTEYHRFDYLDIKAMGYQPDENVTMTIRFGGGVINSTSVNATRGGVVYANWTVIANASIGVYTLNITSTSGPTIKNPQDIQSFTVPGFDINITTRNLAGEPVANVTVNIFENAISIENATSDSNGLVSPKVEIGNYTGEAYFKNQTVGEQWLNVTGAASFDFECNLTNLRAIVIAVVDDVEISVPEVKVFLTPENLTASTNITGLVVFHSLLPNFTYTLNFSRYNTLFNLTTIPNLLIDGNATAWFNLNITCPKLALQINVTNPNANNQPISNATVKVQELMGGIFYENDTNTDGIVVFNPIFGRYKIEVYEENGIKLNEITVDLFEDENISISCSLYGLDIAVRVVDYFGQPIPNALVTLQREGLQTMSLTTQSDGTATFSNIVGGDLQITVYLTISAQPCVSRVFSVNEPSTIEIKIEKYTMLAGFLVETSQLIAIIIIVATIILVLSIEVYRRKRRKSQKSESQSENK